MFAVICGRKQISAHIDTFRRVTGSCRDGFVAQGSAGQSCFHTHRPVRFGRHTGDADARPLAGISVHGETRGHADDRKAWDLLGDARDAVERAAAAGSVPEAVLERARELLRAACGSDWCWWYGEEHSSENDVEFDRLYRRHLIAVYKELRQSPPEALQETLITTRRLAHERSTVTAVPHDVARPDLVLEEPEPAIAAPLLAAAVRTASPRAPPRISGC